MEIKRILCPIDFSVFNEDANSYASLLANATGAEIIYLHCVAAGIPWSPILPQTCTLGFRTGMVRRFCGRRYWLPITTPTILANWYFFVGVLVLGRIDGRSSKATCPTKTFALPLEVLSLCLRYLPKRVPPRTGSRAPAAA